MLEVQTGQPLRKAIGWHKNPWLYYLEISTWKFPIQAPNLKMFKSPESYMDKDVIETKFI